jgi:hypothetical protein
MTGIIADPQRITERKRLPMGNGVDQRRLAKAACRRYKTRNAARPWPWEPRMEQEPARSSFLAIVLTLMVLGMIFTFFVIITGGFFLYVLALCLGFGVFGYLHYLLWGRSLTRNVETGQETESEETDTEGSEWSRDEPL